MAFEDLLKSIQNREEQEPEPVVPQQSLGRRTPRLSSFSLPTRGDIKKEANFSLRTPLKNYFMHELPDQIGAPDCWHDEFSVLIDTILDCDSFFIEPAKVPKHQWEDDCCIQRLGFAAVSRERIEDYLIELSGDTYVSNTDICVIENGEISFQDFVDIMGMLVPTIRLFAREYFQTTSCNRFSLDPLVLVFSLPPGVRPLAAIALDCDRKKNYYSPSCNRDYLTARSSDEQLRILSGRLSKAVPSMGSLVETARKYRIQEIKPLVAAYRKLYIKYMSVWARPAPLLSLSQGIRPPKIIGR